MGQVPEETKTVQETAEETTSQTETAKTEPKTFDEDYVKKLRAEAAEARTARNELEKKVKSFEDRDKTEQQKLEERAATAEGNLTKAEMKVLRFEVAADKGIPLKHAHRLQGSTKEELAKDADELAKELGADTTPGFDGGARKPAPTGGDMDALIRRQAGRA
jgi:hypothetical protein